MGRKLTYCESCGKRISPNDFTTGMAIEFENRTFCRDHIPAELRADRPPTGGTSRRKAKAGGSPSTMLESVRATRVISNRSAARSDVGEDVVPKRSSAPIVVIAIVILVLLGGAGAAIVTMQPPPNTNPNPNSNNNSNSLLNQNSNQFVELNQNQNQNLNANKPAPLDPLKNWRDRKAGIIKRTTDAENAGTVGDKAEAYFDQFKALREDAKQLGNQPGDRELSEVDMAIDHWAEEAMKGTLGKVKAEVEALCKAQKFDEATGLIESMSTGLMPDRWPKKFADPEFTVTQKLSRLKADVARERERAEANQRRGPLEELAKLNVEAERIKENPSLATWEQSMDLLGKGSNVRRDSQTTLPAEFRKEFDEKFAAFATAMAGYHYATLEQMHGKLPADGQAFVDRCQWYLGTYSPAPRAEVVQGWYNEALAALPDPGKHFDTQAEFKKNIDEQIATNLFEPLYLALVSYDLWLKTQGKEDTVTIEKGRKKLASVLSTYRKEGKLSRERLRPCYFLYCSKFSDDKEMQAEDAAYGGDYSLQDRVALGSLVVRLSGGFPIRQVNWRTSMMWDLNSVVVQILISQRNALARSGQDTKAFDQLSNAVFQYLVQDMLLRHQNKSYYDNAFMLKREIAHAEWVIDKTQDTNYLHTNLKEYIEACKTRIK